MLFVDNSVWICYGVGIHWMSSRLKVSLPQLAQFYFVLLKPSGVNLQHEKPILDTYTMIHFTALDGCDITIMQQMLCHLCCLKLLTAFNRKHNLLRLKRDKSHLHLRHHFRKCVSLHRAASGATKG